MVSRVKEYLAEDWTQFEQLFAQRLASRIPILNKVNEYLMERSGKQLRPMLCLLAARLCTGHCSPGSISSAAASELIHTATLLHDDVADEADTRRGRPTVSALISPRASVLVGDYWLSRGVMALIEDCGKDTFGDFAMCLNDLAEGEMFQIEKAAALDTDYDDYIYIISHKTASLFRAAVKTGAREAGASSEQIAALDEFAHHLGLAFQMRDDIFDYSPSLSLGKPTGVDIRERKITLPLLGAFENAGGAAVEAGDGVSSDKPSTSGTAGSVRERIVADIKSERFDGVLQFVQQWNGLGYAQKVLEQETAQAVGALESFPDSPARQLLSDLARSLCLRQA